MQTNSLINLPTLEQILDRTPVTVTPKASVLDVIASIHQSRAVVLPRRVSTSCALVVEGKQLVGIVTERDVVRLAASEVDLTQLPVSEIMTQPVITLSCSESAQALDALSYLRQHRIRHLPVVDAQGQLVGLVTQDRLRQVIQPAHLLRLRCVAEVMTTDVLQVPCTFSVLSAAKLMADHQVSCVVIGEEQAGSPLIPVGMVTERDIVQFQLQQLSLAQMPVHTVMSAPLVEVRPDDSLWAAQQLMQARSVRRLVVVGEQGELCGLLTQTNLLQVFDPIEITGIIQALQQQVKVQTAQLRQANQQLQQEVRQRQQVEYSLRQAQDALERQVQERTAELLQANARLQQEIAQHNRIAAELQQREYQWQALFNNALDAIAIANDQGQYVDANPAACKLFGVSREKLLRSKVADFADLKADTIQSWQQFLQQGQMAGEFRVRRPDGSVRETEFAAVANFIPHRHLSILRNISDRKQAEAALLQQIAQDQLVGEITQYIRQTLDLDEVLRRTVGKVRQLLQTDRVVIFRFESACRGHVVMESVGSEWPAMLAMTISDPCFSERYLELYRQGRVSAIADLDTANLHPCYVEFLASFAVKANLVVPILQREQLWGLLVVHHCCEPRGWQSCEIRLLQQLADQVGIAIQQSELYQQTHRELLERQHMQEALQASEERFRSLSASAPIGIFQTNADGICLYANARWQEMAGLNLEDCLGNGWTRAIHPEDRQATVAAWEAAIDQQQPFAREFRLFTSQKVLRWVAAQSAPMRSSTGEIIGYVSTVEEITQRKQAEAALRESEQLYRSLVECQTDLIVRIDLEGCLTFANAVTCQTFGFEPDQYVGQPLLQVVHPDDLPDVMANMQALTQPPYRLTTQEQRAFTVRGIRWFQWEIAAICDPVGQVIELQGVGKDITNRKQAEQKIREQAALIDIATDAIFVRDLEGAILFWNRGAERLYGWTAAEAWGQRADQLFAPQSADQQEVGLTTTVERGVWQGELEQVTKTGKEVTVASRWTLVRNESGHPKSILVVNTDISEKKQLEDQFYRAQRLESLGTLASGIAHDLNNVFTPILAIAQLLSMKLQDLDSRSQEMLVTLEGSARRGSDLVKQILLFARGSQGKRISLQASYLLLEVAKVAEQTFPKSIQIRRQLPSHSLWLVSANPTQLHQVLMNLCVNARDAMPHGGTLTLSAENCYIDATDARINLDAQVGHYVLMTVTDTGTGIAPELLNRIFDPFFTTKEPDQGTGLGLSTVLGIVKNHGGFLQVSSQVGQGTQFQVYLPAVEETVNQTA